jgi:KDO2-lipid IV(A) lauroyltransferase
MLAIALYWTADLLVQILPARVADALCVGLARLAFLAGLPHRRALEDNLARLMAPASRRSVRERAREGFINFALVFSDYLRLGHVGRDRLTAAVDVHGAEHLKAARESGRGVILLSAHVGNWEMGAAYIAALGTPMNVVARPHPNRWVERFFSRRRRAWGISMLPGRPLWQGAARALRRREWVALMADREEQPGVAPRRGGVCAWAAALSRRTGALVLPAVIVRLPNHRYAAYFEPPLTPERVREERFVFAAIRRHLERYPGQWFAFEPLPRGLT